MQILTDILSLFKRKQFVTEATPDDLVVLGRHEEPDMLGVASPIPYKSAKLIKVKDLIDASSNVTYTNINNGTGTNPVGIYKNTTTAPASVNLRSLCSTGNNLSVTLNNNEIEISTTGEPNTASNLGEGAGVFVNKSGEDLRFRSITSNDGSVIIQESVTEIDLSVNQVSAPSGPPAWARYDFYESFDRGTEFSINDGAFFQPINVLYSTIMSGFNPFHYTNGRFEFSQSDKNKVYTLTVVFKASAPNANQTHIDIAFTAQGDYSRLGKSIGFYKGNGTVQNFHEMFQFYVDQDLIDWGLQVNIGADGGSVFVGDVIYFINELK